jgi:hypothetical protein
MSIALLAVILDRRAHHSQCRTRRVADPVSHTRKPVRSEFPDILRRRGRPRGPRRSEQQAPRRPGAGCELSVGFCASSGRSSSSTWPPRSSPWPQGPFAIYHFHRLFHYGVIANLVWVELLIMSFAPISLVVMPLRRRAIAHGARQPPPRRYRQIGGILAAVSVMPSISGAALVLMVLGGLLLYLLQTMTCARPRPRRGRSHGERGGLKAGRACRA